MSGLDNPEIKKQAKGSADGGIQPGIDHGAYAPQPGSRQIRASRADTGSTVHELTFPILKTGQHSFEKPPAPTWSQADTTGSPAKTEAGRSIERIALSQLGKSIDDGYGADGCMESLSNHIIKPHFQEIGKGQSFPGFKSTTEFISWANKHPELVDVVKIPQRALRAEDLQPGDVVIGNKSDGNHAMTVARMNAAWGGSDKTLVLLGNTGHPETAPDGPNKPHFRVQEFIGTPQDEVRFGTHHGGPESASPNNPYNKPNSYWTVVRFKN